MVKNPPENTGDMDSIPGQGTKIPHAAGQLSSCTTTTEPRCSRASHTAVKDLKDHNYDRMQPNEQMNIF